jgi:hypothetical protein
VLDLATPLIESLLVELTNSFAPSLSCLNTFRKYFSIQNKVLELFFGFWLSAFLVLIVFEYNG